MKKRIPMAIATGLLALSTFFFCGCGSSNQLNLSGASLSAIVNEVQGDTITIEIGAIAEASADATIPTEPGNGQPTPPEMGEGQTFPDGQQPEGESGEIPPTGEMATLPAGEMPTLPDGEVFPGEQGGFGQGGMNGEFNMSGSSAFVTNGTVVTFSVTDDMVIEIQDVDGNKKTGSLSDLTKDAILVLTLDENGAVSHILVRSDVEYLNLSSLLGMTTGKTEMPVN